MKSLKSKGFTLIELLVVVAIIGILATVVLSSLSSARVKTRDTRRVSEMKNLETALEMYYLDNENYPTLQVHTFNGSTNVSSLETAMAPYIDIDFLGPYYSDTSGGNSVIFYYKSSSGDNFQSYGIMIKLEDSDIGSNDDGYHSTYYEFGPAVKYCKEKYPNVNNGDWWSGPDRCAGGN